MSFSFERLSIPEIVLVTADSFEDARGVFFECYKRSAFINNGIALDFVQDNVSRSVKNVLRGLHFQKPPQEQGKLVQVLHGTIVDVAVDIRRESKTFGKHVQIKLGHTKPQLLWVPPGFAHGFCVVSETATVQYKVTAEYMREYDTGIRFDDPYLGIAWPVKNPIVSEKDRKLPIFTETVK